MSKFNAPLKKILWVDLEMTGLSPGEDLILEVAAIVTDWDFNELGTYESIIKHNLSKIKERMALNPDGFWARDPDYTQGFLERNKLGKSMSEVEKDLIELIDKNFDPEDVVILSGNSIHWDRRFIVSKWKKLSKRLHYRVLDVSAWKIVFDGKYNKKFVKPNAHRALDDVRGSIEELKYYLKFMKV